MDGGFGSCGYKDPEGVALYLSDVGLFCLDMFEYVLSDVDPEGIYTVWHVSGGYIRQHVPPSIIALVFPMV